MSSEFDFVLETNNRSSQDSPKMESSYKRIADNSRGNSRFGEGEREIRQIQRII